MSRDESHIASHDGILDVFMMYSCFHTQPRIRATGKRLWAQWTIGAQTKGRANPASIGAGRTLHVEYTLTRPLAAIYIPDDRRVVPFTSEFQSMTWGDVRLYSVDGNDYYIAGLDDDILLHNYSIGVQAHTRFIDARYTYTLTKHDTVHQVSVEMIYTSLDRMTTFVRDTQHCTLISLRIITATRTYAFDIMYRTKAEYNVAQCSVFLQLPPSTLCGLSNNRAIPALVDFMFTSRLDIMKHLPPLDECDQILNRAGY